MRDASDLPGLVRHRRVRRQQARDLAHGGLPLHDRQHRFAGLGGDQFAPLQPHQHLRHLAGRAPVLEAAIARREVVHPAAQPRLFVAQAGHQVIHDARADPVDQQVCRRVVADDDHQPGEIIERQLDAGVQLPQHTAARHLCRLRERHPLFPREPPRLRLRMERGQDRHFDDAGRWK